LPLSKLKYEIAKILETEGWVKQAAIIPGGLNGRRNSFDELQIRLKYRKNVNRKLRQFGASAAPV